MMTLLTGRTTPGIERVGETVQRPTGPHSAFVHALLRHLEANGFRGAPRYLGDRAPSIEILSYVTGHVPRELGPWSSTQIAAAATLLRSLHDATADFRGCGTHEIVCHGDPSPCNTVFLDEMPYAFIDFDAAHPGARRTDVGYAAWLWLDLGNPDLAAIAQGRRLGAFVAAYGAVDPTGSIAAVIDVQLELSQRPGAPTSTQQWALECMRWSVANRGELAIGLRAGLSS
jgi:Ser/Thr protein kinase RdoA (MazF antagonist)